MIGGIMNIPSSSIDTNSSFRRYVLKLVASNGEYLKYAKHLRHDKEVVVTAVQQNGVALLYASAVLCAGRDVVMYAVRQNGCAYRFVKDATLKMDWDIMLLAVTHPKKQCRYDVNQIEQPEIMRNVDFLMKYISCLGESNCNDIDKVTASQGSNKFNTIRNSIIDTMHDCQCMKEHHFRIIIDITNDISSNQQQSNNGSIWTTVSTSNHDSNGRCDRMEAQQQVLPTCRAYVQKLTSNMHEIFWLVNELYLINSKLVTQNYTTAGEPEERTYFCSATTMSTFLQKQQKQHRAYQQRRVQEHAQQQKTQKHQQQQDASCSGAKSVSIENNYDITNYIWSFIDYNNDDNFQQLQKYTRVIDCINSTAAASAETTSRDQKHNWWDTMKYFSCVE